MSQSPIIGGIYKLLTISVSGPSICSNENRYGSYQIVTYDSHIYNITFNKNLEYRISDFYCGKEYIINLSAGDYIDEMLVEKQQENHIYNIYVPYPQSHSARKGGLFYIPNVKIICDNYTYVKSQDISIIDHDKFTDVWIPIGGKFSVSHVLLGSCKILVIPVFSTKPQ